MVGRWEFRHIDHFGTRRLTAIHCRDHRVHCYGAHTSTVNISQAAIGLAVVLIGVALVWATPRLDRFAQDSVLSAETAFGGAGRRLKWIGRLLHSCCTTILTASARTISSIDPARGSSTRWSCWLRIGEGRLTGRSLVAKLLQQCLFGTAKDLSHALFSHAEQ